MFAASSTNTLASCEVTVQQLEMRTITVVSLILNMNYSLKLGLVT